MKSFFLALGLIAATLPNASAAPRVSAPVKHAKHGFSLHGEREIIASHIVYLPPHNFQILLSLQLNPAAAADYAALQRRYPSGQLVWVLDPLDLRELSSQTVLRGSLAVDEATGRTELGKRWVFERGQFEIRYFEELGFIGGTHDH